MKPSQQEQDLRQFFDFISNEAMSSRDLIRSYFAYHGIFNFGMRELFYKTIKDRLNKEGHEEASRLQHQDIVGHNGEILDSFLSDYAPECLGNYYDKGSDSGLEVQIVLPPSRNLWQSEMLPVPYAMRLTRQDRPSLDIIQTSRGSLFVSTYGYQYFCSASQCYWPSASSRAFPKSVETYPIVSVDKPVVIIQDQFDASNFSHFLYDYVPRILYFQSVYPDVARRCLYLLGGVEGKLQKLLTHLLITQYNLDPKQFIWTERREIWNLERSLYFFSDQKQITHPLQMCHPRTLRMTTGLIDLLPLRQDLPEKVYVSRADAQMRRLKNEDILIDSLKKDGYVSVELSKLEAIDQISMLAGATNIVGPHGMGFTNILFNKRTSRITEIFCPAIGSDAYAFVSRSTGIEYGFCIGIESSVDEKMSFDVDVKLVRDLAQ